MAPQNLGDRRTATVYGCPRRLRGVVVMGRLKSSVVAALAAGVLVLGLAACGSSKSSSSSSSGGGSSSSTSSASSTTSSGGGSAGSMPALGKKLKVGLVTDIGGLNDHGFNHLAY